jgi:hypothetical protein
MAPATDSVLEGLNALAASGTTILIAIQVDGAWINGTLIGAAAYRAALAQWIGQALPTPATGDDSFLHLTLAFQSVPGMSIGTPYRCPIAAVQGYAVYAP